MGELKWMAGNAEAAEKWFRKGIEHSCGIYAYDVPFKEEALFRYGVFLMKQDRLDEAEKIFQECIAYAQKRGNFGYYGLALLAAKKGQHDLALQHLQDALENYFPMKQPILDEPLFQQLRNTTKFKELIDKYF
jgi:tetratricopeptide (TPR) repeat protein